MNHALFYAALFEELGSNVYNYFGRDNWDDGRFGKYSRSWQDALLENINARLSGRLAFLPNQADQAKGVGEFIRKFGDGLAQTYGLLSDAYSKDMFIKVLAFRLLGRRKVKLPLSSREVDRARRQAATLIKNDETHRAVFLNRNIDLNHFDLHGIGYPIELYCSLNGIFSIFELKHYEYRKSDTVIKANPGNYVIDGGGCWGDTALYFANAVGDSGKIFTFEFTQSNLEILSKNLMLNPNLLKRIEVVKNALWDQSDVPLFFAESGPASAVSQTKTGNDEGTRSLAIDDFVERSRIERIDFIKMDIEGAELPALHGAEKTIRRFRPKMAVCLYHSNEDFIQIPSYLSSLDLGYRFYLDHFTTHAEETVLFAEASNQHDT